MMVNRIKAGAGLQIGENIFVTLGGDEGTFYLQFNAPGREVIQEDNHFLIDESILVSILPTRLRQRSARVGVIAPGLLVREVAPALVERDPPNENLYESEIDF